MTEYFYHLNKEMKLHAILIEIQVLWMRLENVTFFTDEEEEFVNLLIKIGIKKNIARILVFFKNIPYATSHDIDLGTDMRQSEVSVAMQYLIDKGWIRRRDSSADNGSRPKKIYELAKPFNEIMEIIGNEKKNEVSSQLVVVQKLRECVSRSYEKLTLSLSLYYLLFYILFLSEEMSPLFAF
jgi:predicted transcriptional regulator